MPQSDIAHNQDDKPEAPLAVASPLAGLRSILGLKRPVPTAPETPRTPFTTSSTDAGTGGAVRPSAVRKQQLQQGTFEQPWLRDMSKDQYARERKERRQRLENKGAGAKL